MNLNSVCKSCKELASGYCTGCIDGTIDRLTKQLSEARAEMGRLRQELDYCVDRATATAAEEIARLKDSTRIAKNYGRDKPRT